MSHRATIQFTLFFSATALLSLSTVYPADISVLFSPTSVTGESIRDETIGILV